MIRFLTSMPVFSFSIIFFALIFIIYFIWVFFWRKNQKKIINDNLEKIIHAVKEFEDLLDSNDYFNNRKLVAWMNRYKEAAKNISPKYKKLGLEDTKKNSLEKFFLYSTSPRNFIDKHNLEYEKRELAKHKAFFDCLENRSLDVSQREAIIHEEDSNLVIAGAGCGKTTTLIGKIAFLSKIKNIPKEQILTLAFTRKATNEMKDRIKSLLNEDFDVNTFHSFGFKVLSESMGERPSLGFESESNSANDFIRLKVNDLSKNDDYAKKLTEFFFYEFITCSKDRKTNKPVSYKGEIMKNNREVKIANFLYVNGLNYEYEVEYRIDIPAEDRNRYKPDFYLPENDIYIEFYEVEDQRKASNEIKWKRKIHKKNSTKVIEISQCEDTENELLSNLRKKLEALNIRFSELFYEDIFKNKMEKNDRTILIEVISSFLNLFKSNQYNIEELYKKVESKSDKQFYLNFLELFIPIYNEYQNELRNTEKIDFSDMIAEATVLINEKKYLSPYRYILIDEFQDISIGRYKLIKALLSQQKDSQLFCVGDDWQSIFKFAGSDVSLFLNFEKYFGFHKKTKIENTYRFNDKIADLSNKFIMQNHDQLSKTLSSAKKSNTYPYSIFYKPNKYDESPFEKILDEISEMKGAKKMVKVLILGRYNWDEPKELESLKQRYIGAGIDLQFLTIHKAKGLESDYVIINNVHSGFNGFPSEVLDHEILNLVLQEPENYPYAEERRLFYVAMTRTKSRFYIVGVKKKISCFIFDLALLDSDETKMKNVVNKICPDCKADLVKRAGRYGEFLGCSNFPRCKFTMNE